MITEEQRDALVVYRRGNAHQTLDEIPVHIKNGFYKTAMNRMYYACYYIVIALLVKRGIETQTHAGVRQMLGLYFVKTGKLSIKMNKFYNDLFANRQEGDYADFVFYDYDMVSELYPQSQAFIEDIEKLIDEL